MGLSKVVLLFVANVVIVVVTFVLVEGLASVVFVAREIAALRPIAERVHTEYDPDLGWINRPNLFIPDLFGPGADLRTNARSFRSDREVDAAVPSGKVRVVCSGDSFTFGYGVGNHQTWCERLAILEPRFETVNMGLGGFGIDQAYLWYRRDGVALEHDVHLFAIITEDFRRMEAATFHGRGKPLLELRGEEIVVTNVPVPRVPDWLATLRRSRAVVGKLDSVRWLRELTSGRPPEAPGRGDERSKETRALAARIFDHLHAINREKGSTLVVVYLPTRGDYLQHDSDPWRAFLREAAARGGWRLLDLVEEMRTIPPGGVAGLFLGAEAGAYHHGEGHFSAEGNDTIARMLLEAAPLSEARGRLPAEASLPD